MISESIELLTQAIEKIVSCIDHEPINEQFDNLYKSDNTFKAIIGESPYSDAIVDANYFGFPEVAFLSTNYSLSLISIMGVLFDSIDSAINFLEKLKNTQGEFCKDKMQAFAFWLAQNKNIILINRNDNKHQYRQELFQNIKPKISEALVIGLDNQDEQFKKDINGINNITIVHPSSNNYQRNAQRCCETYFERKISAQNGVKLSDFKII